MYVFEQKAICQIKQITFWDGTYLGLFLVIRKILSK